MSQFSAGVFVASMKNISEYDTCMAIFLIRSLGRRRIE